MANNLPGRAEMERQRNEMRERMDAAGRKRDSYFLTLAWTKGLGWTIMIAERFKTDFGCTYMVRQVLRSV